MIAVVVGLDDPASTNVRDRLLEMEDWREVDDPPDGLERVHTFERFVLVEKQGLHIYFDGVDAEIQDAGYDLDLVVFVSRHSGDTGRLLSAHHTGNWSDAKYGGEPRSLAEPAPAAHRHLLRRFESDVSEGWNVSMEATHHGPSELETPSVYAEVGSGGDEWRDEDAARTVASGVLSLERRREPRWTLLGLGGGHYSPRFTRLVLETDAAFGHVAPDHELEEVDGEVLERAQELSGADGAVLDGDAEEGDVDLGGLDLFSESYLRRRTGVAAEVADELDEMLGDRWSKTPGTGQVDDADDVEMFGCPALVREAYRTDPDTTEEALTEHSLGYSVDDEGVPDSVAVGRGDFGGLVESAADVLRHRFEIDVDLEGGVVEARREEFDPEMARELGVPEGPEFGRLADGESVEVDGRVVEPRDVTESVEREFDLS